MINVTTRCPRRVCSAMVPPQPSTSSSGCAAMTSASALPASAVMPDHPLPGLLAQLHALKHAAVGFLQLEKQKRTGAAGDDLTAGPGLRAPTRTEDGAGPVGRENLQLQTRAGPDAVGGVAKPAEGARVRPRQRPD